MDKIFIILSNSFFKNSLKINKKIKINKNLIKNY